ncbi:MAG: hypothetical protein ACKVTZ_22240, partial [Bacteroidia bacterium]
MTIIWKRAIQAVVTCVGYLPLFLGGVSFWLGLAGPLGLAIVVYLLQTQFLDLTLRQVTLTCGTRLTKKIQLRVGNLNQAFQFYMRQIDAEERVRDISDAEWTHRSAWWMKLSMWV